MNYKFELTEDEANVVLSGLGELPAKVSLSVIQKIQAQAKEQTYVSSDAADIAKELKEQTRKAEGGEE